MTNPMTDAEMLGHLAIIKKYWGDSKREQDCEVLLSEVIDSLRVRVEAESKCNHKFNYIPVCIYCEALFNKDKDHA